MNADGTGRLAELAGIVPRYRDLTGRVHVTSSETRAALLAAMGLDGATPHDIERPPGSLPEWLVLAPGAPARLPLPAVWRIELEDGGALSGRGEALPPLPAGIHVLHAGGQETTLLVAPPRAPAPPRAWGMTLPIWGLTGPDGPGLGDFAALGRAAAVLAGQGAAFLGINPVHAGFPTDPALHSPYSPSHRRRLNILHVPTPEHPGVATGRLVDYAAEIPAKRAALRRAHAAFRAGGDRAAFAAWRAAQGPALERFIHHQALSERFGPYWTDWPAAARDPATAPPAPDDETDFHAWAQWRAETALAAAQAGAKAAGMAIGLYLDLAVGTHPAGAETWAERDVFAGGVSLGAPPDAFSPSGQTWCLAPFNPRALVARHFRPLAETLRAQLRFAGLVRIDHILGFDRAFWVPQDGTPGAYVAMPRAAMLAVLRIEAARAGAAVVGEDLGNVPAGLREALAESGILGCRILQFEERRARFADPRDWPPLSLAAFGTHDLPGFEGWRRGADIALRRSLGHLGPARARAARAARVRRVRALAAAAGGDTVDDMHRLLARAGSLLVALQAGDVLGQCAQDNLPGTVDEYPNWRHRLPVSADGLGTDARVARAARIMQQERR